MSDGQQRLEDSERHLYDRLVDAAETTLRECFWCPVWLLADGTVEVEAGNIWFDWGQGVRATTRGANKLEKGLVRVVGCYVVHQDKERLALYECSYREPKAEDRWRSLSDALRDGPLLERRIVRQTKRVRLSALAG